MSAEPGEGRVADDEISSQLEALADEGGPGYAAYLSHHQHVRLTAPLRALLAASREDGRSPILVTGEGAVLSPLLVSAMRLSGGCWAVRTDDGVYDGLTGSRIHAFTDFGGPRDPAQHPAYTEVTQPQEAALMVEVIANRRADEQTTIGPLAEAIITALGGAAPDRWGVEEPLSRALDHPQVTASIRAQMPVSEPHLLGAPDGSYALVSVARTQHGLTERVRAGIPVGRIGEVGHDELVQGVGDVFLELLEHAQLVVAFGSVAPVVDLSRGMAQRPGLRDPERPLAVLIGPRATRDLQVDVAALQQRFDVSTAGRARTPSLLLRTPGEEPWQTVAAFAAAHGDRLATALGVDDAFLSRMGGGSRTGSTGRTHG